MTLDVRHIMASLSEVRPIFYSEADFQFALAWQVQKRLPASKVRMEFKPFPHEGMYLDVWIRGDTRMAIELKYKTRTLESEQDGELFIRNRGCPSRCIAERPSGPISEDDRSSARIEPSSRRGGRSSIPTARASQMSRKNQTPDLESFSITLT